MREYVVGMSSTEGLRERAQETGSVRVLFLNFLAG